MEYRLLVVQHRSVNLSHMHFLAIKMHSSRYHTCLRKALHTIFIETVQLLLTIGFAPSLHTIYSTVLKSRGSKIIRCGVATFHQVSGVNYGGVV